MTPVATDQLPSRFRGVRTFQATAVTVAEGDGTPDDPVTEVTYIYDEWGVLMAVVDPDRPSPRRAPRQRIEPAYVLAAGA